MRNYKWRKKKTLRKLGGSVVLSPQSLLKRKKAAESFDERTKEELRLLRIRLEEESGN